MQPKVVWVKCMASEEDFEPRVSLKMVNEAVLLIGSS